MRGLFEILPRRFVVPTMVGNYSPHWALVVEPRRGRGANSGSATLESSDRTCSVLRGSRRGRVSVLPNTRDPREWRDCVGVLAETLGDSPDLPRLMGEGPRA